ncbi:MAG: chemotaxis protein CheA [Verrucomicrobiae bacterium]|nr:chemotaxis protein CheA [Verrucomicrobiae bacterium]
MEDNQDIIQEFVAESLDGLTAVDHSLLELERNADQPEHIKNVFRVIHTIKGSCGFLGLGKLERITHAAEELLSQARDGQRAMSGETVALMLETVDVLRSLFQSLQTSGRENLISVDDLIARIVRLQKTAPGETPVPTAAAVTPGPAVVSHGAGDDFVRVHVSLLDNLMTLVGELVLARNQIVQSSLLAGEAGASNAAQRINLITSELQESVMKTRLQSISVIWGNFPRMVRDLSLACHKKVQVEMEGAETEMDRALIEAIRDPLTHLIRNAVDHGIESAEVRRERGKPETGLVLLRAFHEGGQVIIEISDDGNGIDGARLRKKAGDLGLVGVEELSRMTDAEALSLVFLPGLSTAQAVTNISGRGVGMDVVRTNIEKIGGTIDISSAAGRGTVFKVKIPLTLAIIPALIVSTGGDQYAIPQISLLELVRLSGEQAVQAVEMIHHAPVYRLRGRLLPLVYLNRELALETVPGAESLQDPEVQIVVLQGENGQFGLVVDEINDTQEIVVKPLGSHFKGLHAFAGTTIMGDGRVALILDVPGLAQKAGLSAGLSDTLRRSQSKGETAEPVRHSRSLLLFEVGRQRRMAVPLSMVARLEEIAVESLETSASRTVVQYRGRIMPLVRLSEIYGGETVARDGGALPVVVYQALGGNIGLVVDRILDIIEDGWSAEEETPHDPTLHTAVIDGHVTDLLDLSKFTERHCQGLVGQSRERSPLKQEVA